MTALRYLACVLGLTCYVPLSAQNQNLPLMDQFTGVNFRRTDKTADADNLGFVREYHDWALDIGYSPGGQPDCNHQNVRYRFNRSFDGATSTNFDDLYSRLSGSICPVLYGASPFKMGYSNYPGLELLEQLPVCNNQFSFGFNNSQQIPAQMSALRDYTLWVSLFAARYGNNPALKNNNTFLQYFKNHLHSQENRPGDWMLGNVGYVEIWNEPDKNWRSPMDNYRFTPAQYAATLSAAYDGHHGAAAFAVAGVPGFTHLGIKNVDPNIKVVFGGLSALRGCYVEGVIDWCRQFRPTQPLPFDVLNFHHYNNTYYTIPQKSVQYVWDHFCPDYYNNELQLGEKGVCPEIGGMRERLIFTLQSLVSYDERLAEKEFWLSETGYDIGNMSPQRAEVPGIRAELAQAQWLVRTYLEASAAVITLPDGSKKGFDKVLLYDLRDAQTGSNWLFGSAGIHTDVFGNFAPKTSWYFLRTFRNKLENMRFEMDLSDKNNSMNPGKIARMYEYRQPGGNDFSLVVWSPTQENKKITGYKVFIPNNLNYGTKLYATSLADGSESGLISALPIQIDPTSKRAFVQLNILGETPVFISNVGIADAPPCPTLTLTDVYASAARIAIDYPLNIDYDSLLRVYFREGSGHLFETPASRLYTDALPKEAAYFHLGGLAAGKTYQVWLNPTAGGQSTLQPCSTTISIPAAAPIYDMPMSASMIQSCDPQTPPLSNAWKLFDEPWINTRNFSNPQVNWQCQDLNGCSACIRFEQPGLVDAVYFYVAAGLGDLDLEYLKPDGSYGVICAPFRVTTGMHGRWYHCANFANGIPIAGVRLRMSGDLQIGEMRFFSPPGDLDIPAGPPPTPQWRPVDFIHDCAEGSVRWEFPDNAMPADFDHFSVWVNNKPPATLSHLDFPAGPYKYHFPVEQGKAYAVKIVAYDRSGHASDTLSRTYFVQHCDCASFEFSAEKTDCGKALLRWENTDDGSCTQISQIRLFRAAPKACASALDCSAYTLEDQLPASVSEIDLLPGSESKAVAGTEGLRYCYYLSVIYTDGLNRLYPLEWCFEECQSPPADTCACKAINLSAYPVQLLSTADSYTGLGDPCVDVWPRTVEAVRDEQGKFEQMLQQACNGSYIPGAGNDYSSCNSSTLEAFAWPLSEWFPGWSGNAYPATLRIDFNGEIKNINRVYLYDTNGDGQILIQTENADGIVSDWGTFALNKWRTWHLLADDQAGRMASALRIVRLSSGARFSEIGICGNSGSREGIAKIHLPEWKLLPNPANDKVCVRKPAGEGAGVIQLFDGRGQLIKQHAYESDSTEIWIDLQDLPAGYYLLHTGKGRILPLIILPDQNR